MKDFGNFEDIPVQPIGLNGFDPRNDQIRDNEHLLLYIWSEYDGADGHFKYGTTNRKNSKGEIKGNYARELFANRFKTYAREGSHKRKVEKLFVLPRVDDGITWTDTLVGNRIFGSVHGIPESDVLNGRETVKNTTAEELEKAIVKHFNENERKSIWSVGGFHKFQQEVAEDTIEVIENNMDNPSNVVRVVQDLAPRFGKNREFLLTAKKVWENFGNRVLFLPSYWLSTHSSIMDPMKYEEFSFMTVISTKEDNWEDRIEEALENGKMPVVMISLHVDDPTDLDVLKSIPPSLRASVIDEADIGTHTSTKRDIIDKIVREYDPNGRFSDLKPRKGRKSTNILIEASGTNIQRYAGAEDQVHGIKRISYFDLLDAKKNGESSVQFVPDVKFMNMKLATELASEMETLDDETRPSWSKLSRNPKDSSSFWKHFIGHMLNEDFAGGQSRLNIERVLNQFPKMPNEGHGLFIDVACTRISDLEDLEDLFQKHADGWVVGSLHGEKTTNKEAENYVNNEIINERYNPDEHKGFIILSMKMGSRSFTVEEIDSTVFLVDGGDRGVLQQMASRCLSGGPNATYLNGKEKDCGVVVHYGFDQSQDITPIEDVVYGEVAKSNSSSDEDDSLEETVLRLDPVINMFTQSSESGNLKKDDVWEGFTDSDEYVTKLVSAQQDNSEWTADRIGRLLGVPPSEIRRTEDREKNFEPGSSGGENGGGENYELSDSQSDKLKKRKKTLSYAGPLFANLVADSSVENIREALNIVQNNQILAEDLERLLGVTVESYEDFLDGPLNEQLVDITFKKELEFYE